MKVSKPKIRFFYNGLNFSIRDSSKLKGFLEKLVRKEGKNILSINYIFCRDKDLKKLNIHYLNHDYYTDILTFDLSESKKELRAEIFISIQRVRENANQLGYSFSSELHRVMIHGLLHLCGFKDKTKAQIKKMRAAEERYLAELWLSFHVKRHHKLS